MSLNIGRKQRTVSLQISIPRSESRSSTLGKLSGERTYIIITRRMISGDQLDYRNGLAGVLGLDMTPVLPFDEIPLVGAFALTVPPTEH